MAKYRLVGIVILLYIVVAVSRINWLGLQYDEVLWANVGQGIVNDSFVTQRIGKYPVMMMPYIGALKGYLYFVLLRIFPPTVELARLPMIVVGGAALGLVYLISETILEKRYALLATLLVAISPVYWQMTSYDVGPNAIETLLKLVAWWSLIKLIEKRSIKWLMVSVTAMVLGVYNKLNFIWWVNALIAANLLVFFGKVEPKKLAKYMAVLIIPFGLFGYVFWKNNFLNEIGILAVGPRLMAVLSMGRALVSESIFYDYLGLGESLIITQIYWWVWGLVILFGLVWGLVNRRGGKIVSTWLMIVVLAGEIALTKKATAPWHIFMLVPLLQILLAWSLQTLGQSFGWAKYAFLVPVAFLVWVQTGYWWANKDRMKNTMWSPSIANLAEITRAKNNTYIMVDWGVGNQLVFYDGTEKKYWDIWPSFQTDSREHQEWVYNSYLTKENYRYVTHERCEPSFPCGKERLIELAKRYKLTLVREVLVGTNNNGYEIYRLD